MLIAAPIAAPLRRNGAAMGAAMGVSGQAHGKGIISAMSLAVVLIPLVGVFAGCALAPQTVGLHPKVELPARPGFGKGNRVALEAVDARPEKLIGYRGGVMKTGPITAANAA